MSADSFTTMLNELRRLQPFRVFTVELNGGRRFEVDHPEALILREGVAVFMAPAASRSGSTTRASIRSSGPGPTPGPTSPPGWTDSRS